MVSLFTGQHERIYTFLYEIYLSKLASEYSKESKSYALFITCFGVHTCFRKYRDLYLYFFYSDTQRKKKKGRKKKMISRERIYELRKKYSSIILCFPSFVCLLNYLLIQSC